LEGEGISRLGRMLAVADSFEVMTAARPFHRPMTVRAARKELRRCSGTQFDPAVVRAFGQISAFRLYFAIGAGSLIAFVPFAKRLPARLGRAFSPVANLAAVAITSLLVLGAIEGAGNIRLTLPKQPARLLAPVALTTPGTFTNYVAPFTTSHTVATLSDCTYGLIEDRTHLYVSGCDGAINRFSLFGGAQAEAEARRLVGANSSMVSQGGNYYFALRALGSRPQGIYTFDPDTLAPGKLVVGIKSPLGMTVDPLGDSLYVVSQFDGLYRVDDPQGQPRVHLVVSGSFDGVTTSSDGSRLYVPSGETVLGFDRSGSQVLKVEVCCHHPDGLIILGDGTKSGGVDVSGDIFVNDNDGTILRIDTYHGNNVTVVASGGQRGDFMVLGIDGCLYATQGVSMVRMEPCFSTPGG
jgi:DNA-binding beta-propeller fold protein YncE